MSEHADSVGTYTLIFLALIALTGVTTAVAYVDLGPFSVVVALTIAVVKMLLVALFFMHLRHSTTLTRIMVGGGLGSVLWFCPALDLFPPPRVAHKPPPPPCRSIVLLRALLGRAAGRKTV